MTFDKAMSVGLVVGVTLGFVGLVVMFHVTKPAIEVATTNYIRTQLVAQTNETVVQSPLGQTVMGMVAGAVHAGFAELPI